MPFIEMVGRGPGHLPTAQESPRSEKMDGYWRRRCPGHVFLGRRAGDACRGPPAQVTSARLLTPAHSRCNTPGRVGSASSAQDSRGHLLVHLKMAFLARSWPLLRGFGICCCCCCVVFVSLFLSKVTYWAVSAPQTTCF